MCARALSSNPRLGHLKKQAKALLKAHQSGDAARACHPHQNDAGETDGL